MPRLSLITVCRNSKETIEDTLQSVAKQSFRDYEHIVIDGASDDGTLSIVKSWTRHKLKCVSEPDRGIYDAMNKGIAVAEGEIIGFLNADDMFFNPDVLQNVADAFDDAAVDCCFGDLLYVKREDPDTVVRYWKSGQYKKGAFAKGWCPAHPTFYVRKYIYEKYGGFDERYEFASDVELMMRFLEKVGITSAYVANVWVKMRTGGVSNRSMRNVYLQNKEILSALKTHGIDSSLFLYITRKLGKRFLQYRGRGYSR